MAKKKINKEDEIITKLSNPWEFLGYALRYRTKELLAILVVILIAIIAILQKDDIAALVDRAMK